MWIFLGKDACKSLRTFTTPRIGVADDKIAQYAGLHYYTDKELQVQSDAACKLACELENEFLCRSYLYRGEPQGTAYNCQLFHLDHWTLPDGPSTYLNAERPLIDNGERVGTYYENFCESKCPLRLISLHLASSKKCFSNIPEFPEVLAQSSNRRFSEIIFLIFDNISEVVGHYCHTFFILRKSP